MCSSQSDREKKKKKKRNRRRTRKKKAVPSGPSECSSKMSNGAHLQQRSALEDVTTGASPAPAVLQREESSSPVQDPRAVPPGVRVAAVMTIAPDSVEKARKRKRTPAKQQERKTLTAKKRRLVVLKVLKQEEGRGALTGREAPQQHHRQQEQEPQQQQAEEGEGGGQVPAAWTSNLGKGWNKDDLAKLTRMAASRTFLQQQIPEHPADAEELDFELISKYFGRCTVDGRASCKVLHGGRGGRGSALNLGRPLNRWICLWVRHHSLPSAAILAQAQP
jgi:hypothetical protein